MCVRFCIWELTLGFVMGIFLTFLGEGLTVPFLNWLMVLQSVFSLVDNYLRIGLPAGLQGMVFAVSNLVVQSAINSLGPEVMAASSAAFTIEANVYAFVDGFGQAATTFVGQNYGARQLSRCFAITRRALLTASGSLAAVSLVCCLLAVPLMQCFTSDADIIRLGVMRIYFVTGIQCLNAVIEVLSGSLRGFGISLPPAAVTLLGTCGTRVAWVEWAFPLQPTFFVLLMGYPLCWLLTAALLAGVYYWAKRSLIQG